MIQAVDLLVINSLDHSGGPFSNKSYLLSLESDLHNAELQQKVFEARELLLIFNATHAKWVDQVIQARWMADGDRGTKLFYKSFKGMATAKEILSLLNPVGSEKNPGKGWLTLPQPSFRVFWERIRKVIPCPSTMPFYEVLSAQSERLTEYKQDNLNAPLTVAELGSAVCEMVNQKCLGPDGIPVEFSKANRHTVGPLALQCLEAGIAEEHFPEFVTKRPPEEGRLEIVV